MEDQLRSSVFVLYYGLSVNAHLVEVVEADLDRFESVAGANILLDYKAFDTDFIGGCNYARPVQVACTYGCVIVRNVLDLALFLQLADGVVLDVDVECAALEELQCGRRSAPALVIQNTSGWNFT